MDVQFSDLTLMVDGMKYEVSRYGLSCRSKLLETIFQSESPADGVQEAWTSTPKGPLSTFSLLLEALYTGIADVALPQKMLDYFMTVRVTYGMVFVGARYGHVDEVWYVPRQRLSEETLRYLRQFHNRPHSFDSTPRPKGRSVYAANGDYWLNYVRGACSSECLCYHTSAVSTTAEDFFEQNVAGEPIVEVLALNFTMW